MSSVPLHGGCAAGALKASASPRSCSVTWFPARRLWTALPQITSPSHPAAHRLSILLPVLQLFLSPPVLGHPLASSPPLQPSPLPCLHSSLSALFASHHSIQQPAPFCGPAGAVTYSSPRGAASQRAARAASLLLHLRWLVTAPGL